MNKIGSIQVHADPAMPQFKEVHRQERKWCHRLRYDKRRRFNVKYAPVVVRVGGNVFTHPDNMHLFEIGS